MTPIPATLSQAIDHYLAGTASAEQQELVHDWYHSFNDEEIEVPASIMNLRTQVAQKIWARLETTMQQQNEDEITIGIPWYRNRWLRVAAVAAGLLAGGYWLLGKWKMPDQVAQQTAPVTHMDNDVAPGSNKAILTLANGFKIVLDSVENGTLATQGHAKIVKLDDGQVVYNMNGQAVVDPAALTYNTITTPKGGQFQLRLADGTKVWLNAASSIRYPTTFAAHERLVEITGEAYFEVTPSAALNTGNKVPFVVDIAGKARVEVLGTHFNISSYDDEDAIRTTLLEGKVKVISGISQTSDLRPQASVMLQPGEQALLTTNHKLQTTNKINLDEVVAWKNGLFQFDNTDIKVLMRQIARWYDIEVHYEGAQPAMRITGKAPRNISLASMLKILELSDVKYKIEGRVLTVKN